MSEGMFIIGRRDAIILQSAMPLRATVAVKFGKEYHKIRDITGGRVSDITKQQGSKFKPDEWISVGKGADQILLHKHEFEAELSQVTDEARRKKLTDICKKVLHEGASVEDFLNPSATQAAPPSPPSPGPSSASTRPFRGVTPDISPLPGDTEEERKNIIAALRSQGFKVTVNMSPEGELQIVAKKQIGTGTYKIAAEDRKIWEPGPSGPAKFASAKGRPGIDQAELLKEVPISESLIKAGVPYVLMILQTARSNSAKVGLWLELCEGGDLNHYLESHFDPTTHTVLPEYRKEHITLACQVADGITGMHQEKMVHNDLKLQNVLVAKPTPTTSEARVADFGLVGKIGTKVYRPPGTYPPPEVMVEYHKQTETLKAKQEKIFWEEVARGASPDAVEEQINKMTIDGIELTEAIDAWAYGVLLFAMTHDDKRQGVPLYYYFAYNCPPKEIESVRDYILNNVLDPANKVDQAIAQLLHPDPSKRITIAQAKQLLTAP